ncbi:hypothetical protein ACW9I4_00595 [Pseudomonas sp. SDT2931_S440]|jgi:hypothetical protein|uniref:hypothetical protein n=2 Tax=unclassified Pseudomonas TaxID=196821 RepID=UPI0015A43A29|nr:MULTISPECIES: hypothetical protein [unclassified Pseudomonas]MDQ0667795.1 hypothetical protein [Pseudomonas sp. W2I6]NVZ31996.1 hypothetical protein [Pseudomonas sp. A4002]NWA31004.1 hypothetical protein [Pseudomonas sp. C6002]NWB11216.1 hypothetical protein [Pseudomonas sp. D5002]NWB20148.1 hypothetical protein [Pseudomonas sp. D4002]
MGVNQPIFIFPFKAALAMAAVQKLYASKGRVMAVPRIIFPIAIAVVVLGAGTLIYQGLNGTSSSLSCADDFSQATVIEGVKGTVAGDTTLATSQAGESGHIPFAKPYHSVWCKWTSPEDASFTFDTTGSKFDTVLAVYKSTSLNSMPVAGTNNNQSENDVTSAVTFSAKKGETYSIAVDGFEGAYGKYILNWAKK